ncbi:MAG TPA: M48 family metalloprotease [Acidimicrobiales bacterium]|nr:M48 family metalloprotease [Acidimicrobiales bacterium]
MYQHLVRTTRRSALLLGASALLLAVAVVAIPAWLVGLGPVGVVVAVAVVGAAAFALWWTAERVALSASRARPADPGEHARLHNLVEGLCVASGLPKPDLYVVDDEAPNALALGRSPQRAAIVVTTGLLATMTRVELEAVLAHELSHIKHDDVQVATLAVTAPPLRRVVDRDRHALADIAAVEVTRYPPALVSALEKLRDAAAVVQVSSPAIAHLWIESPTARPEGGDGRSDTHPPIEDRIATLREL